jgi:hypothetical protein
MVFKPVDLTPLSAIALGILAERAGVPSGLLSIVTISRMPLFLARRFVRPKGPEVDLDRVNTSRPALDATGLRPNHEAEPRVRRQCPVRCVR